MVNTLGSQLRGLGFDSQARDAICSCLVSRRSPYSHSKEWVPCRFKSIYMVLHPALLYVYACQVVSVMAYPTRLSKVNIEVPQ